MYHQFGVCKLIRSRSNKSRPQPQPSDSSVTSHCADNPTTSKGLCFVLYKLRLLDQSLLQAFLAALDLHIPLWTSQQPFFGQSTRKIENKLSTQQPNKPKKDAYAHKTIQHQPKGKIYLIVKIDFCYFRQKYAYISASY